MQHGIARIVQHDSGSHSRGHVDAVEHAVAIDAPAKLDVQARIRSKSILGEEREICAANLLERWTIEVDAANDGSVGRGDHEWAADARSVEGAPEEVDADLEQMKTAGRRARRRHGGNPLIRRARARLTVEEVAERGLGSQFHRLAASRLDVGAIVLHADRRL